MHRRKFTKVLGISAFVVSATGFKLIEENGTFTTNCVTSRDILGPFFRPDTPLRTDLTYPENKTDMPVIVIGQVFGADCKTPLKNIELDVWHCDHNKKYDMKSDAFRCRGKMRTDENGTYRFKTFVPPPYGSRPKHIHYLIHEVDGYKELVTQLYFKGDSNIKKDNWIKYPWDERRILDIYKNGDGLSEVKLDLYLQSRK